MKPGVIKIATYNVNGVNGRLPVLLRWLGESKPDVVCLQELKAPQEKFPEAAIRARLAALEGSSAQAAAAHRRLEAWRERLLADDAALTRFAAEHPGADLQEIRALIRNARKEQQEGKPPRCTGLHLLAHVHEERVQPQPGVDAHAVAASAQLVVHLE